MIQTKLNRKDYDTAQIVSEEGLVKALNQAIKERLDAAFNEAIEKAKKDLELTLRKQLAEVVMTLHKHYRVDYNAREIVIRVENRGL